jgi:hypothetical protein
MRETKGNKKEVNKTESKHRGVLSSSPTKPKNTQSIKQEEKGYQYSFHSEKKKKQKKKKPSRKALTEEEAQKWVAQKAQM